MGIGKGLDADGKLSARLVFLISGLSPSGLAITLALPAQYADFGGRTQCLTVLSMMRQSRLKDQFSR